MRLYLNLEMFVHLVQDYYNEEIDDEMLEQIYYDNENQRIDYLMDLVDEYKENNNL